MRCPYSNAIIFKTCLIMLYGGKSWHFHLLCPWALHLQRRAGGAFSRIVADNHIQSTSSISNAQESLML